MRDQIYLKELDKTENSEQQTANEIETLCLRTLKFLAKYYHVEKGIIYRAKEIAGNIFLKEVANLNGSNEEGYRQSFREGRAVVGSCYKFNKTIIMNNLPKSYFHSGQSSSGTDSTQIIVIPLNFKNKVVGAIELAFINEVSKEQVYEIEKSCHILAEDLMLLSKYETVNILLNKAG